MALSRRIIASLVCGAVLALITLHLGLQQAISWSLHKEAEQRGLNWAVHISKRIPNLGASAGEAGFAKLERTFQIGNISRLLGDVLAKETVYQVDLINSDCFCAASFGSHTKPFADGAGSKALFTRQHLENGLSHKENILRKHAHKSHVNDKQLKHILLSEHVHAPKTFQSHKTLQYPVDWKQASRIVAGKKDLIFLHSHVGATQPHQFAEIYHPVMHQGKVAYLLRVLVDLQAASLYYHLLFYLIAIAVIFACALCFTVPMRQYWRVFQEKRDAKRCVSYLANHDVLTGLPNRTAFCRDAIGLLKDYAKMRRGASLLLIEIHDLEEINNFDGRLLGDRFLQSLANRLLRYFDKQCFVGFLGGGTFAVLIKDTRLSLLDFSQLVSSQAGIEIFVEERNVSIPVNAGVSNTQESDGDFEELLKQASLALQHARASGKNTITRYDPSFRKNHHQRIRLFRDFHQSILDGQIVPYYQPIVDSKTGAVKGFEALARWAHPEKGIQSPAVFHEALNDKEIARLLGAEMLKRITHDMGKWKMQDVDFGYVSLNVTDADLERKSFVLNVANALGENKLIGKHLVIEVTENCILGADKNLFLQSLKLLQTAGCRIALDDFGTGFSSITHIKEMPRDLVKIDRSFIKDIVRNKDDQAIVKAIKDMGQSTGFKIVVEGVEELEQLEIVQSLGADLIQGYLFAKPTPAHQIPDLIQSINNKATTRAA